MSEFRVTFGQQYPSEPHPWPLAHRDGWLAIDAPTYAIARDLTVALLGRQWCDIYDVAAMDDDEWTGYFPLGELARVTYTETGGGS